MSSNTNTTLCPSGQRCLARSEGTVPMRRTVRETAPGQLLCALAQSQTDGHVDNWRMVAECILVLCFCGYFGGKCGYLGSECGCLGSECGYLGGECVYLGSVCGCLGSVCGYLGGECGYHGGE